MFDTVYSQIGGAFTLLVVAFAFLKGDEPERIGAGAFVMAFLASMLIQTDIGLAGPQWGLMAIDVVLLGVFGLLILKSRRAWPVWACAFQGLVVMSHVLVVLNLRPNAMAFYAVTNLSSYGILVALAVGTFWAWQERRAAGVE